jgi:hypothetical protein
MDVEQTDLRKPEDEKAFSQFLMNEIHPNINDFISKFQCWFIKEKSKLLVLFYPNTYTEEAFTKWCRQRFYYWLFNTKDREIKQEIEELLK